MGARTIVITRAVYLRRIVEVLSQHGAKSAMETAKFGLPSHLETEADLYVPVIAGLRFAQYAARREALPDLAFLAGQRIQIDDFDPALLTVMRQQPTLLRALELLSRLAAIEDTCMRMWLEPHGETVRVCTRLLGVARDEPRVISHWLQNSYCLRLVRSYLGPAWGPATIAFEADYATTPAVEAAFPNTRIIANQSATWIELPRAALSTPPRDGAGTPTCAAETTLPQPPASDDLIGALRLVLPSYLPDGYVSVALAAEMVGTSARTLQRELAAAGLSYSQLVDDVRYARAAKLLATTDCRIIEIGFAVGYADPAHFTRAFRRISGSTPSDFRARAAFAAPPLAPPAAAAAASTA